MSIKSVTWSSENSPQKPYPKLMANDFGVVVLFKNKYDGVIVNSGTAPSDTYKVGVDVSRSNESAFKDYIGSVTLENT